MCLSAVVHYGVCSYALGHLNMQMQSKLKQTGCENLLRHRFELELELLPNIEHLNCYVDGDNWEGAKKTIRNYFLCHNT